MIDTSAWYPYFVTGDKFYPQAIEYFTPELQLVTTNTIFEEVLAIIHHRHGKKAAIRAGETMLTFTNNSLWVVSAEENKEVMNIYRSSIQKLDYVDASLVWLARKLDIPVFTFDAHFKRMKVVTVP